MEGGDGASRPFGGRLRYLEYLDSLVDKQIAEDNAGQVESSAKGDGLGGTEIIGGDEFILDSDGGGTVNGFYYTPEEMEYIREVNSPEELARVEKENAEVQQQIKEGGEKARAFANDPQAIQDFVNELRAAASEAQQEGYKHE